MRTLKAVAVLLTAVLVTACPYHGSQPIGPITEGLFDPRLVGEWVADRHPDQPFGRMRLRISQFDKDRYVVTGLGVCPYPGGRAHLARLGNELFLNVKEHDEAGLYRVARVSLDGNLLTIRQLDERHDTVTTVESLQHQVLPGVADDDTYYSVVILRRTANRVEESGNAALQLVHQNCLYEDTIALPADEPPEVLKPFMGTWDASFDGETQGTRLTRTATGAVHYIIDGERTGDDITVGATRINNVLFLSIREDWSPMVGASDPDPVTIARVYHSGDTIELRFLNTSLRAASPAALRKLVDERMHDPSAYYWQTMRMTRRKR